MTVSLLTHFVADTYPYRPGTTMRTGKPCSNGSGSPFMATAKMASRPSSVRELRGVDAVNPSTLSESTMSASPCGDARRSTSRIGTPCQIALPTSPPPTSFDTHVRVTPYSSRPMLTRSSKDSSIGLSTMPSMVRRHVEGSTFGTVRAVSTR